MAVASPRKRTTPATRSAPRPAYVLGGNRVPFAKAGGPYAAASELDLLTAAVDGLVARYGLAGRRLGLLAAGAVLKHSRDFNLARETVLSCALDPRTPALDLQMACATGMEAVTTVADRIALGRLDAGVAGGVDSASDAPIVVTEDLRRALLALNHARTPRQRLTAIASVRPGHLRPVAPTTAEPRTGLSMGEHQALTTAAWGITREAQDELALASHRNLAAAWDAGFFDDLVTPYRRVTRDTTLRADTSLEKLATLPPVFGKHLDPPTMTAGNSTPLTDGASAVLLGTAEWATEHGVTPLARLVDTEVGAVDFVHGRDGLLMAPAHALPRLLARTGLTLQDFDFYEIHEAFAATVLTTLAAWESEEFCRDRLGLPAALGPIDRTRLNVHGSSLATGHPFAATGGRIVATLAKTLHERGGRGLVSVCAAGGQGVVAILEAA